MNNKRGFSLIELLAVIVILGLLLGMGFLVSTRIIDNSRKEMYLAAVKTQVEGVKLLIESEEYDVYDENTTYYFSYNILKETENIKSPYGDWEKAYVVVIYDGNKLKYYWTGIDTAGWRIDLGKEVVKLKKKDIYNKKGELLIGNSLEGKDNIVIKDIKDGKEIDKEETPSNHMTKEEADKCYEYEILDDNTCRITDYKKSCGPNVNVPSSIDGSIVKIIGQNAFRSKGITNVIMYDGVQIIENGAFQNNKISKLKLSKTLKKIQNCAFYINEIVEVSFPEGLESIGSYAFARNQLTKVILPESLKSIGTFAFYNNKLTDINFNSNPTIGGGAFSTNKVPSSEGIIYLYDSTKKQFNYTTIIGYCSDETELTIPNNVNGIEPKTIRSNAFASTGLKKVTMPNSIEYIGSDAFAYNNITDVNLSTSLKTIGYGAFRSNEISKIDIPDSVTSIGNFAFTTNIMTGDDAIIYARNSSGPDYTTIVSYGGGRVTDKIKTYKLTIPAKKNGVTLKTIKSKAFIDSHITSITLPNLADTPELTIENDAFMRNAISGNDGFIYKITNGTIDYSILSSYAGPTNGIGSDRVITIPEESHGVKLKAIQASFGWMYFYKIVVPSTVETIDNGVFAHSNRNNVNFNTIVNKTNRNFDWYGITSSSIVPKKDPFEVGTIFHQSGNIEVIKG